MTEPAVPRQTRRSDRGVAPRGKRAGAGRDPAGTPWRKVAAVAAAGIPVGLLWWLLAPSGLNLLTGDAALRNGSNIGTWLPRDLVLAGLFLLAGCIAGAVASGKQSEPSSRDVVLLVVAGALGALIAWGTGVLCGSWWGTPEDASTNASIAFSLRSYAVLIIWPAAVALSIFLGSVFTTPPEPEFDRPAA